MHTFFDLAISLLRIYLIDTPMYVKICLKNMFIAALFEIAVD